MTNLRIRVDCLVFQINVIDSVVANLSLSFRLRYYFKDKTPVRLMMTSKVVSCGIINVACMEGENKPTEADVLVERYFNLRQALGELRGKWLT